MKTNRGIPAFGLCHVWRWPAVHIFNEAPRKPRQRKDSGGFARADLFAVLGGLILLGLLALPLTANNLQRSHQLVCWGNLKQIGQAFKVWGVDHGDTMPIRVPMSRGGTQPDSGFKVGATWVEFYTVRTELGTPRILSCPSDDKRRAAKDFSASFDGGYLNASYRNQATSYFLGTDVIPELPNAIVSGDRNMRVDLAIGSCSAGINNASGIHSRPSLWTGNSAWTNGVHGLRGNFLRNDGTVEMVEQSGFRRAWHTGDDNGSCHLLMPN